MEEDTEQHIGSKGRRQPQPVSLADDDVSSTIKSRYGRAHKPKHISEDFLATNKRISSVTAKNSPRRSTGSPEGDPDECAFAYETQPENIAPEENLGENLSEFTADEGFNVAEEGVEDMAMADDGSYPEFLPGDLMWGRVGNHPFWPCMILVDAESGLYYKTTGLGRLQYHVIFYGDKGRRSWVGSGAILRFLGKEDMEMQAAGITPEMRRRDPKWFSGFFVKDSVRSRWESAVNEAEDAMPMTRDERADAFFESLPPKPPKKSLSLPKKADAPDANETQKPDETVSEESADALVPQEKPASEPNSPAKEAEPTPLSEPSPKRSNKESISSPPPVKRGRGRPKKDPEAAPADTLKEHVPASQSTRKRKLNDDEESDKKKTSGASAKEDPNDAAASDGPREPKKRRRGKAKKTDDGDFEAYREKHMERFLEDHPDLSSDDVEKYMRKLWSNMTDAQKSKYQSRLARNAQSSGSEVSGGGDSSGEDPAPEDDAKQETSGKVGSSGDNGSQDQTNSTKKRKLNLFRGFRFERVCQICELPGNTVKCKGPCASVFHRDCVYNEDGGESSDDSATKRKKRGRGRKAEPPKVEEKPAKKVKWTLDDIYMKAVDDSDSEYEPGDAEAAVETVSQDDILACILGDVTVEPEAAIVVDSTSDEEEENGGPGGVMAAMANRAKTAAPEDFRCMDCVVGRVPLCFSCGKATDPSGEDSNRYRCGTGYCGKYYHAECLKMWPQSTYTFSSGNIQTMTCPQHVCHTCLSEDRDSKKKALNERLVRCVRCPTTYHYGNYCVPAGSEVLTCTQIICPRHYSEVNKKGRTHINASWCFICAMGGTLICCDLCPSAFHADCLQISPPKGSFICEDCESGRFPLYHEVVWVKLGSYRWWPSVILFPTELPDNIRNMNHSKGEFAVRFLGTNDYYWINGGRCFLYQEGDSESRKMGKSQVDGVFQKALVEAQELHKEQKELKATREAEAGPGLIKPPSYVKIKTNRPVGNVKMFDPDKSNISACECDPNSEHPCSPESDCLNRILLVECDPNICAAGSRCENQCFDKRQYPPLEPWRTEGRGWGLRTLADIKKGSFVIEYVGEVIDDEEFKSRMARKHKEKDENYYFLTIDSNRMIDAGPKGNLARFMNHSCQPNCETQKWTVAGDTRVGLFALRDIPAESELTFNYNLESQGFDKKPCMCGAPECVGFIGAKKNKPVTIPVESTTGKKRGRRSRPADLCFSCGESGDKLITCDNKACGKMLHLGCADLKAPPTGKWLCPRHKCHTCGKRTLQSCTCCVLAYCTQHVEGNLVTHPVHGLVCKTHEKNPVRPNLAAEGERSSSPNVTKQAREEEKRRVNEIRKQKEDERRKKEEEERASRRSRREKIASTKRVARRKSSTQDDADAPSEASSEDLNAPVPAADDKDDSSASDDEVTKPKARFKRSPGRKNEAKPTVSEEEERASGSNRQDKTSTKQAVRRKSRKQDSADTPSEASSEDLNAPVPAADDREGSSTSDNEATKPKTRFKRSRKSEAKPTVSEVKSEIVKTEEETDFNKEEVKVERTGEDFADSKEEAADLKEDMKPIKEERESELTESSRSAENAKDDKSDSLQKEERSSENPCSADSTESQSRYDSLSLDSVQPSTSFSLNNLSVEEMNNVPQEKIEPSATPVVLSNEKESENPPLNPAMTPRTGTKKAENAIVGSSKRKFRGKDPMRGTATINRLSLVRKDPKEPKGGPFDKSRLSTELEDLAKSFGNDDSQESPKLPSEKKEKEKHSSEDDHGKYASGPPKSSKLGKPKRPSRTDKARVNTELDDVMESFVSEFQGESKKVTKKHWTKSNVVDPIHGGFSSSPAAHKGPKSPDTPTSLNRRGPLSPNRKSPNSLNGDSSEIGLSASKLLAMQRAKGLKVMPPNRHLSSAREKVGKGTSERLSDELIGKVQRASKGLKVLKGVQRSDSEVSPKIGARTESASLPSPKKARPNILKPGGVKSVAEDIEVRTEPKPSQGSAEADRTHRSSPVQNGSAKKKAATPKKATKDLGVCPLWNQDVLNILL